MAEEELEEGGTQYAGTSGLAGAHIKVGDEEESISGTVYFGPPLDDRNWNTNEFDYCWTAYQVYQMEDGTVYLDGSGNSYGGMGGFTTKVTDTQTKTADGEEEIFSFTAEVTMESVERVTELEVRWYGGGGAAGPQDADHGGSGRGAVPGAAPGGWSGPL